MGFPDLALAMMPTFPNRDTVGSRVCAAGAPRAEGCRGAPLRLFASLLRVSGRLPSGPDPNPGGPGAVAGAAKPTGGAAGEAVTPGAGVKAAGAAETPAGERFGPGASRQAEPGDHPAQLAEGL